MGRGSACRNVLATAKSSAIRCVWMRSIACGWYEAARGTQKGTLVSARASSRAVPLRLCRRTSEKKLLLGMGWGIEEEGNAQEDLRHVSVTTTTTTTTRGIRHHDRSRKQAVHWE